MGNVLSVSIKDEKNDTNDATPTSSTDANTTTTSLQIVSDDPISSTSSDVVEQNKSKSVELTFQSSADISETMMEGTSKGFSVDPETDFMEINISSVSREKITENVEDLVHDLESLLGESTDSFNIPVKRKENQKAVEQTQDYEKIKTTAEIVATLPTDDPVSSKGIEHLQDCISQEDEIKDASDSYFVEEPADTIETNKEILQEDVPCNANIDIEEVIESKALEVNETVPLESDTKVITEDVQSEENESDIAKNDVNVAESTCTVIIEDITEKRIKDDKYHVVTNEVINDMQNVDIPNDVTETGEGNASTTVLENPTEHQKSSEVESSTAAKEENSVDTNSNLAAADENNVAVVEVASESKLTKEQVIETTGKEPETGDITKSGEDAGHSHSQGMEKTNQQDRTEFNKVLNVVPDADEHTTVVTDASSDCNVQKKEFEEKKTEEVDGTCQSVVEDFNIEILQSGEEHKEFAKDNELRQQVSDEILTDNSSIIEEAPNDGELTKENEVNDQATCEIHNEIESKVEDKSGSDSNNLDQAKEVSEEGDTVCLEETKDKIASEKGVATEDVQPLSSVSEVKSISEPVSDNIETIAEEAAENVDIYVKEEADIVRLDSVEKPVNISKSESQTNIPESSKICSLEKTTVEPTELIPLQQRISSDTENFCANKKLGEMSFTTDSVAETHVNISETLIVVNTSGNENSIGKFDSPLESNQEILSETVSTVKISSGTEPYVESAIVAETAISVSTGNSSQIAQDVIEEVTAAEEQGSEIELLQESTLAEDISGSVKTSVTSEINALTEGTTGKCVDMQVELVSEDISNINESVDVHNEQDITKGLETISTLQLEKSLDCIEVQKITEDHVKKCPQGEVKFTNVAKLCNETSTSQLEKLLKPDITVNLEITLPSICEAATVNLENISPVAAIPSQQTTECELVKDGSGSYKNSNFSVVSLENKGTFEVGCADGLEKILVEDKKEGDREWVHGVLKARDEDIRKEKVQDDPSGSNYSVAVQILDDDLKPMEVESGSVPFLTSVIDSDSEDTVPTLVLEPDDVSPSPGESSRDKECNETEETLIVHSTSELEISEKLPEIEEILNDEGNVEDVVESIDMQENLETILAVASLQNADAINTVQGPIEPQMSDKERREMEAIRKAVESITETPTTVYGEIDEVVELVEDISTVIAVQPESEIVDSLNRESESALQGVPVDSVEETIEVQEQQPEELKTVQCTAIMNDVIINQCNTEEDFKQEHNLFPNQEMSNAEGNIQAVPDTSEDKIETKIEEVHETVRVLPDSSQSTLSNEDIKFTDASKERESRTKVNERPKRHKKSSVDNKLEELSINVDVPEREKPYSPKVTIKPIKVPDEEVSTTSNSDEVGKGSLKMTITKQSDKMHSILKICDSENSETAQEQDEPIPKLIIKPKMQQVEQQHSPKMSTRSSKQMYSPTSSTQRSGSPRITIKPVIKPDKVEPISPLKIKIKPEEGSKRHSPKLNIKLVTKAEDETREIIHSPRKATAKHVSKSSEEVEQVQSPRITIKPIPKPESEKEVVTTTPRLNIKPIKKQEDEEPDVERERSSPKIIFKPIVKPESDNQIAEGDDDVKERIVLKINKGNLPTPTKDSKKREHPPDDEKSEKLAKITVKFSKGGGHAHIVQQSEETNKRSHEESCTEKVKKLKTENESPVLTRSKQKDFDSHVETRSKHTHLACEVPVEPKRIKLKDTVDSPRPKTTSETSDDVRIVESKTDSPIVISEDSRSQDSGSCIIIENPNETLGNTPVYEVPVKSNAETPPVVPMESVITTPIIPVTPTPRKRGRPRKVPIVIREEFKDQDESKTEQPKKEEPPPLHDSGRPKRSCRGQSVRATLGIKPRKPRGPGRGRGSKRGMGTRAVTTKPEEELKLNKTKLKLIQESLKLELLKAGGTRENKKSGELSSQVTDDEIKPPLPVFLTAEIPSSPTILQPESLQQDPLACPAFSLPTASLKLETADSTNIPPATPSTSRVESAEIVMVDEETRMSADINSRSQTPAKQVVPSDVVIEESQSSVQSTATTESGKAASRPNKAPRLEVQEPEGAVISADQLTEYYWNGNGPFMLQEQVAQFLGIKSFKRKYPGIMRRMLEMQERDFIRESGLASEHMCDLGLTAVNSADILDIMYSDFQDKYEEYCKHQRDRQAKDLINKQKALSLAASQEKNKADITEQAVQSAAQWNATFNKTRREQRKACMDLQTLTVHYPKGKMKQINKAKVGNYPVALVPGQFTDYYKEFTPTEINNLPLNTMCYDSINIIPPEDSDESGSEGSDSDSDSSTSSSGSCSSSSGVEDCKLCKHTPKKGTSNK